MTITGIIVNYILVNGYKLTRRGNLSVVIGVRIPRKLKEELEKLGINYSEEIRRFLEQRVKEEKAKILIKKIEEFKRNLRPIEENLSAKFIREDRDRNE